MQGRKSSGSAGLRGHALLTFFCGPVLELLNVAEVRLLHFGSGAEVLFFKSYVCRSYPAARPA